MFFLYSEWHSRNIHHGINVCLQEVKSSENHLPKQWPQSRVQVVNYQRFYCTFLTGKIFDVVDKWLLVGGGCTWRFNCM